MIISQHIILNAEKSGMSEFCMPPQKGSFVVKGGICRYNVMFRIAYKRSVIK